MHSYGTEYLETAHLGFIPKDYKNDEEGCIPKLPAVAHCRSMGDGFQCV